MTSDHSKNIHVLIYKSTAASLRFELMDSGHSHDPLERPHPQGADWAIAKHTVMDVVTSAGNLTVNMLRVMRMPVGAASVHGFDRKSQKFSFPVERGDPKLRFR